MARHHGHMAPPPPPPSVVDLPLSISTLLQIIRDAEHLATRYGSTTNACARLEELERAHIEMQTQIATLHQKLNMAMVAAAAAQVDQAQQQQQQPTPTGSASGPSPHNHHHHPHHHGHHHHHHHHHLNSPSHAAGLNVDALVTFLQRHCALRGDPILLAAVLHDFQRLQSLPPDHPAAHIVRNRDVLISIQEIVSVGNENADSAQPSPGHYTNDVVRKKPHSEHPRMTPKAKTPASTPTSSPALSHHQVPPRFATSVPSPSSTMSTSTSTTAGQDKRSGGGRYPVNATPRSQQQPRSTRQDDSKQAANAAVTLSAMSTMAAAAAAAAAAGISAGPSTNSRSSRNSNNGSNAAIAPRPDEGDHEDEGTGGEEEVQGGRPPPTKRKRVGAPQVEVVVKQNLVLPHDKRNIVELKQSSSQLTLVSLEAFNKTAPWDVVYKQRAQYSHILNYNALSERAAKWFVSALRVQFVWRREFWERLHWLPMSEAICTGPQWERYRQTRKRRANKAIAAWRKVYGDSLELMRMGLLPEDVWCDVALWYMPGTPLYWLPNTPDLDKELREIDAKHPVRCYHLSSDPDGLRALHPFYRDGELQRKYPNEYALPPPELLALQNEDKESRVNITPE